MPTRWIPHAIAAAITVPFAIWVATSDLRGVLHPAAWLLPLAGAYYLGLRIGREVVRGVLRAREEEEEGSGRWMPGGASPGDEEDADAGTDRGPIEARSNHETSHREDR